MLQRIESIWGQGKRLTPLAYILIEILDVLINLPCI